jgi:hypothetical protein
VKPAGSLVLKKYRHGLWVGTGPVRVPGRTGSTGNWPNRSGSQRFRQPCSAQVETVSEPTWYFLSWRRQMTYSFLRKRCLGFRSGSVCCSCQKCVSTF